MTKTPVVKPHPDVPTYRVKQSRYKPLKGLNVLRLLISAPSNSGKTVLISSILLDMMRGAYEKIYLFSPSADLDSTWLPVKKYAKEKLGQDQHKEPWYFHEWNDAKLQEILDEQKAHVLEQKRRGDKDLDQIVIVVDDFADSDVLQRNSNSPLTTLMCRGRHSAVNVIQSVQKMSKLSTISRCQANALIVFAFHSYQDADMFITEYGQLPSTDGKDGRDNLTRLLQHATAEPYSFLFINLTAPPERRFMKNFDKYLSIEEIAE